MYAFKTNFQKVEIKYLRYNGVIETIEKIIIDVNYVYFNIHLVFSKFIVRCTFYKKYYFFKILRRVRDLFDANVGVIFIHNVTIDTNISTHHRFYTPSSSS